MWRTTTRYRKEQVWALTGVLVSLLCISWCIYRDIHIERQYTGDLRNRVVGARMQKDGRSPYFYHWKWGDGLRYYDWNNDYRHVKISNITATPFFHTLLYPLAELPQRTISRIWLVVEYLALMIMSAMALFFAKQAEQKWAVVLVTVLFLFCYGWLTHVEQGQLYIFVPLLAMLFYLFMSRTLTLRNAFFAGLAAAVLLLIRPNTILFFLPFVLLVKRYPLRFKITLLCTAAALVVAAVSGSHAREYWGDYFTALNEHVRFHQFSHPAPAHNLPLPVFDSVEGWDTTAIARAKSFPYYKRFQEQGNLFVLMENLFHKSMPVWMITATCVAAITLLFGLCYVHWRRTRFFTAYEASLTGFFAYMISDICSPIHRANYNAVQWLFPLLLTAASYRRTSGNIFVYAVIAGLWLNSLTFSPLPMRHTLGEYLVFASLLGLLFTNKPGLNTPRAPLT